MSGAFPRDGMDAAILRLYFEMTRSQQQAFLAAIERTVGGGQPFEEAMIEFLWDCGIAPTEARQTVQRAVTAESGGWRNTLN